MRLKKILRQHYEAKIDMTPAVDPPAGLIPSVATPSACHRRLRLETIFGLLVTAGYLLQLLLPTNWFSFGRFMFIVRFGF